MYLLDSTLSGSDSLIHVRRSRSRSNSRYLIIYMQTYPSGIAVESKSAGGLHYILDLRQFVPPPSPLLFLFSVRSGMLLFLRALF